MNFSVLNLVQVEESLEVLPVPGGGDAVLSVPGVVVVDPPGGVDAGGEGRPGDVGVGGVALTWVA